MKFFCLLFSLLVTTSAYAVTYSTQLRKETTTYSQVNGSLATGSSVTLFTSSSSTLVTTYISGDFSFPSTSGMYMVIGPTAGNNPTTTNGSVFFSPFKSYRRAGATATSPSVLAVETIYNYGGNYSLATGSVTTSWNAHFDKYMIPSGYSVYIRNDTGGSINYAYEIEKTEETQQ